MKIVEKTATRLHLRSNLRKHEIRGMLVFSALWSIGLLMACLEPTKMQLNCRKSLAASDCQITTWNVLNLHSQTKKVQLTDVQLQKRRKAYPILLLQTDQGIITSPSSERAYDEEQQIQRFLMQSQPGNLQMSLTVSWSGYLSLICISVIWVALLGEFLMMPFTTDWQFELDESELDGDRQRPLGRITGIHQGLLLKRNISRELGDVVGLDVKRTRRNSYAILSMCLGKDLRLSISGLSEPQWQEINHALSEILQVPPHQVLQNNRNLGLEDLEIWIGLFAIGHPNKDEETHLTKIYVRWGDRANSK